MSQEENFTLDEANLMFAKKLNGDVWDLLEKKKRTSQEQDLMIHAAHASLYHWLQVGTVLNQQRGEYVLARVYTAVGQSEAALRHAQRCLQLTGENPDVVQDFDRAFAYECLARAYACAGNRSEALFFLNEANRAGELIADLEDKKIFHEELSRGDWFGMR
jgi:tetratricopeptide (TPR) repeat protein